jgi:threonine synthase
MSAGISLVCPRCRRELSDSRCPSHPDLVPEWEYDPAVLRERYDPGDASGASLWRYAPLLPVSAADPISLGEGGTDLVDAPAVGDSLGVDLGLKIEGANPTGSAKDRGSAVVATRAVEADCGELVCASTGNAAASIAAYAARGGLDCSLFVPERLPEAKAAQPLVYGASLVTVAGGYGDACRRCRGYADGDRGGERVLDRSAGANPYTPAGARTLGFELAEQAPEAEWIAVSMGNGGTIADLYRGYELFERLGYVAETPRLLGVEAAGAPTIRARDGAESSVVPQGTCADSIDVDEPHRAADATDAIERSGGTSVTVDDDEIRRALRWLGRDEGVFAEPAGAAALAGVERGVSAGIVDRGDRVVAVTTGNGLKDTDTALEAVTEPE